MPVIMMNDGVRAHSNTPRKKRTAATWAKFWQMAVAMRTQPQIKMMPINQPTIVKRGEG